MLTTERYEIVHSNNTKTWIGQGRSSGKDSTTQHITETNLLELIGQVPLPFPEQPREIIGWGTFSVACRLPQSNPKGPSHVAVFRELPVPIRTAVGEFHSLYRDCDERLDRFSHPFELMITDGIRGEPMLVKLSPEVKGATLCDIGLLHLLGNRTALGEYVSYGKTILEIFQDQGYLADTGGNSRRVLVSFVPLMTSNIMLEYGTNRLRLVDSENIPANNFRKTSLRRKMIILGRVFGIAGSVAVAEGMHRVLDWHAEKLDQTYTQEELEKANPEELAGFEAGFEDVITRLNERGIPYRVVGSFAVAGILNQYGEKFHLTPRRRDGTKRDIDILILQPKTDDLVDLQEDFNQRSQQIKGYPHISLVIPFDWQQQNRQILPRGQRLFPRTVSELCFQDGVFGQKFESLFMTIPDEDLTIVNRVYHGVEFPTLKPEILVGLYLTRFGAIQLKDLVKLQLLTQTIEYELQPQYIDYARRIREKYPHIYRNLHIRQWFTLLTGGFFETYIERSKKRSLYK